MATWGRRAGWLVLTGVAMGAGAQTAQVAPLAPRYLAGDPPPAVETFAAGLQRNHVALTETALLAALRSQNGEVRGLAAAQLATMDDRAALPQIIRAIQDERDPQVQVNLAGAASWMNSRRGMEQLQQICGDVNVPSLVRLDAARYVSNKQDPTCFAAVRSVAVNDGDPAVRVQALVAAANYRGQADGGREVATAALADTDATVRVTAADTLRRMRATQALPALEATLTIEGDDTARAHEREAVRVLGLIQPATP